MYELSDEIREAVRRLNDRLSLRFEESRILEGDALRQFVGEHLGTWHMPEPATKEALRGYEEAGGIVGVDGSVNRAGGASPHYIDLFQGLAKSTAGGRSVFVADFDSPMQGDRRESESAEESARRDQLLAEIEIKTAIKGIQELRPKILMMDGSLLRYRIYSEKLWEELKALALETNTVLFGVIKDIKTSVFADALRELGHNADIGDREMLYGRLTYREMILLREDRIQKKKTGLSSAFLRSSHDPNVIGIDILEEQRRLLVDMASLVLALTPYDSRGVPLWLDIVDKEVKISDKLMEALLKSGLRRELYEIFIVSERQKRN